jgi:hypothetical protein
LERAAGQTEETKRTFLGKEEDKRGREKIERKEGEKQGRVRGQHGRKSHVSRYSMVIPNLLTVR